MSEQPIFPGVFVSMGMPNQATMEAMNRATREWEMRAARGECSWICSDCCMTFSGGMPDTCAHGHQTCTDIIQRDKQQAQQRHGEGGSDGADGGTRTPLGTPG